MLKGLLEDSDSRTAMRASVFRLLQCAVLAVIVKGLSVRSSFGIGLEACQGVIDELDDILTIDTNPSQVRLT
jgi:hypothetical protein